MAMADWSSLPSDLVRCVGDRLLAASDSDIDDYMGMRAVCHNWRQAMADPCRRNTGADLLRFRPRHWVMLDDAADDEGTVRLFFNVVTGRFIRRRVPLVRNHLLVAASGGLLVLGDGEYPHAAHILNPFTGSSLHFADAIPREDRLRAAVAGSEDPSLVFSSYHDHDSDALSCAHLTAGKPSPLPFPHPAGRPYCPKNASMAAHRGHVYVADRDAQVVRCVVTSGRCYAQLITSDDVPSWELDADRHTDRAFLVESAEELLLVRLQRRRARWVVKVFRVDVERKKLEAVRGIGCRALLVGDRCLSVDDAGRLPPLRGNCVYRAARCRGGGAWVYQHDLGNGSEMRIRGLGEPPVCMAEVLLNHYVALPDAKAQLHRHKLS